MGRSEVERYRGVVQGELERLEDVVQPDGQNMHYSDGYRFQAGAEVFTGSASRLPEIGA